ncbi:hypothetical protein GT354_32865 [Streptomyces sp. SID3343]|nr:hypothetical protein [Streptomyces sp. SID3343]
MPVVWLWLIVVVGAALGCGVGFGVGPLVRWLIDVTGSAPAPFRIAAKLRTVWAVPVLTLAGTAVGLWVASVAREESPVVTVEADHIAVRKADSGLHLHLVRDRIGALFTDGRDLVVLDRGEAELARVPASDLSNEQLAEACERFDYPWRGTADPREAEFTPWVDGVPDLDEAAHALLRARKHALTDKQSGAAAKALDDLRAAGLTVRDRKGGQQYRRSAPR